MPLYEFVCPRCVRSFEVRRPLAERDLPISCPACDVPARRAFARPRVNLNGALSDDPIVRWQFQHLDDRAWSRSREI